MPGTGLSSYRPPGVNHHFVDYITDVKRVVDGMFNQLVSLSVRGVSQWATGQELVCTGCVVQQSMHAVAG